MKKHIYFIILSLSVLLFSQCTSLHKKLTKMAVNLSASAPVMLDPYTRFEGASVTENNIFQYNYTILNTQDPEKMVNDMMVTMESEMKEQFKMDPNLRIFTENDVTIEYIYKNANGGNIRTITITPKDYK